MEDNANATWPQCVSESDAVPFDGYEFGEPDREEARQTGAQFGVVDDWRTGRFNVDVVLIQSMLEPSRYHVGPGTDLLLGPPYALIRREFRKKRRQRGNRADRLLLTVGGSDAHGLSAGPADFVNTGGGFLDRVLLGGPAAAVPKELPGWRVIVDPPSVAEVLDDADVVVSAAGSTTWELLCIGVPAILIQTHDNQGLVVEAVKRLSAALVVGDTGTEFGDLAKRLAEIKRPAVRKALSRNGLAAVDGLGARRLLRALVPDANA